MVSETEQATEPLAVSVDEFARRLSIGRTLAYDMIRQGTIRAIKLNCRTIIPVTEIDRILSSDDTRAT